MNPTAKVLDLHPRPNALDICLGQQLDLASQLPENGHQSLPNNSTLFRHAVLFSDAAKHQTTSQTMGLNDILGGSYWIKTHNLRNAQQQKLIQAHFKHNT